MVWGRGCNKKFQKRCHMQKNIQIQDSDKHTDGDNRKVSSMLFNIGAFGLSLYSMVGV